MSDKTQDIGHSDNIKSVSPYIMIQWVCNHCKTINTESFYNYRNYKLFECRKCEHTHRLGDIY